MTSSRYQSKLFNFLSKRSQRFGDSVGRTWRTIRVAANWSLSALLYPVFTLIQKAVNSADKQLRPQTPPQQNLLNSNTVSKEYFSTIECDTAVVHMLEMVKKIPSRENSLISVTEKLDYVKYHQQLEVNDTVKQYLPLVQGIATHLGNNHIVLVTADNKVLDILTLKQQQTIQDKIVAEVAEYWRLRHLSSKQVESNKNLLPEIDRLLHKLTGANTIPTEHNSPEIQEIVTQLSAQPYIHSLDAFVASLEGRMLTVRRIHQSQSLIAEISTLVVNARNHFLGKSTAISQYLEVTNNQLQPLFSATLPKLKPETDETEDLWLTFDDLFGKELQAENQAVSIPKRLAGSVYQNLNQRQLNHSCSDEQPVTQTASQMVKSSYIKGNMTHNPKKTAVLQQVESDILSLNRLDGVKIKQAHQLPISDDKPEFVEITATSVGYEKHILERILEWLDNLMLWLEDKFLRILKLIQQIFT